MEKYKIRSKCPYTEEIYFSEVEGKKCFEYKGFSFFIRGDGYGFWVVSDVLCGMKVVGGYNEVELIEKAKKTIEGQFEKYITHCKNRDKATWKRSLPIEPIAVFGLWSA